MEIKFKVLGEPVPQGSMIAIMRNGSPRIIHRDSSKLKKWRKQIAKIAKEHMNGGPFTGPIEIELRFIMTRPKSVSKEHRELPVVTPDLDKLIRAVLDSLTGVVYVDDKQVIDIQASQRYDDNESAGLEVTVW